VIDPATILQRLADDLTVKTQANLQKYKKLNTKSLYESIKTEVREYAKGWQIVGKSLYYAQYVERGRKAGGKRVPIAALIQYVKDRRMVSGNKEIHRVAWAIQTKIHKYGIKAAPFISDTLKQEREMIRQAINDTFGQILRVAIIDFVNKANNEIQKAA